MTGPGGKSILLTFGRAQAAGLRSVRYGKANPERIDNPFWEYMVRQKWEAHWAREQFGFNIDWTAHKRLAATQAWREHVDGPVFCFDRFGQSVTQLPDGRVVHIGGEHEDWYDPDFCIYNDVVIEHVDGRIEIYTYPRETFPPTDFHTATLVGNAIYLIGSLGYKDQRRIGETQVCVLDTDRLSIHALPTTVNAPGWISSHTATYDQTHEAIIINGGQIATDPQTLVPNHRDFSLDLKSMGWSSGIGEITG